MNTTKYIILVIFISTIVIAGCTPQIRFSSKTFNKNVALSGLKSNESSTVKKAVGRTNSISDNLKTDFALQMHLNNKQKEIINFAESWVGTPYCYGGTDKSCTDCSGFVMQIFDEAGIKLPRTALQQYQFGQLVEDNDIAPGDLVFFIRDSKIGHVGIYVGENQFIHASTNRGVVIQNLDDEFYRETFAGVRRVI
jgi:cell wall-associated NlpC family hydrolase